MGENRILAVVEDAAETVLGAVNKVAGDFTKVTCKALRAYEAFAQNTLGVPSQLCESSGKLSPGGRTFFLHAHVQYKGKQWQC